MVIYGTSASCSGGKFTVHAQVLFVFLAAAKSIMH